MIDRQYHISKEYSADDILVWVNTDNHDDCILIKWQSAFGFCRVDVDTR